MNIVVHKSIKITAAFSSGDEKAQLIEILQRHIKNYGIAFYPKVLDITIEDEPTENIHAFQRALFDECNIDGYIQHSKIG